MKKRLYNVLAAMAMLATGAATIGSVWLFTEEPSALSSMLD